MKTFIKGFSVGFGATFGYGLGAAGLAVGGTAIAIPAVGLGAVCAGVGYAASSFLTWLAD